MRGGLNADWLPSGQALLMISALADVLFRLPEDLTAPLVSLAGGVFGSQRVALVTTWVVLYVALYTFAHLAYSFLDSEDGLALPRTERGFRFLFATTGVALGLAVNQVETQTTLFAIVIPGAFVAGGSFLVYLSVWYDWQVTDPEGQGVGVLDRFTPHEDAAEEIESDLAYEGLLGYLGLAFYLLALSVVFGAPVALAAFALQILVYSFPIPDLLILGWAVSARAIPRVTIGPDRDRILDLEFELERYLVDVIEHATRSVQGFFLLTFCVLGAFLAAGFLFIGVAILPNAVELVLTGGRLLLSGQPVRDLLPVWNVLGTVTLLFLAGTHGLWVWIRELQRLPHFLDAWEDRETRSETEPVTRVFGFVGGRASRGSRRSLSSPSMPGPSQSVSR